MTYSNLEWATTGVPAETVDELEEYCDYALTAYNNMIERGVKAEDAREVLPNATPTIIYVTMNLRALIHFCNERMCSRAQTEIRNVAIEMKKQVLNSNDISSEEKELLGTVLVPKCEAGPIKACPEINGCGRCKPLKEFIWRPKATWGPSDISNSVLSKCSNCGFDTGAAAFNFCPNCGADMR